MGCNNAEKVKQNVILWHILGSRRRRTLSNTIDSWPQNETKSTAGSRARLEFSHQNTKFDLMMWLLTYSKFDMMCWSRAKLKELLVEPNTLDIREHMWTSCFYNLPLEATAHQHMKISDGWVLKSDWEVKFGILQMKNSTCVRCQSRLLPKLSADKIKSGLWHRNKVFIWIFLANRAKKIHSLFLQCFLFPMAITTLYYSSDQNTFKQQFHLIT